MLSYFFLPALLSGIVGLQTDNSSTSADKDEVRRVERPVLLLSNQTLNLTTEDDGVMKPANVSKLEELELELERTGTFNVTMEDDEHFQDQEQIYSPLHCDEETMEMLSYQLCASKFYMVMMNISTEHRCDLDHIIRPYNDMTDCMELLWTKLARCYYPNPTVQDFFLDMHSKYFHHCSDEDTLLTDAPHSMVVVLTLIPVSLIPLLVFLVVWKSKVRD